MCNKRRRRILRVDLVGKWLLTDKNNELFHDFVIYNVACKNCDNIINIR